MELQGDDREAIATKANEQATGRIGVFQPNDDSPKVTLYFENTCGQEIICLTATEPCRTQQGPQQGCGIFAPRADQLREEAPAKVRYSCRFCDWFETILADRDEQEGNTNDEYRRLPSFPDGPGGQLKSEDNL